MDKRRTTFETNLEMLRGQYPDCKVVDRARGTLIFVPPADGRYGLSALEVPSYVLMTADASEERVRQQDCLMHMEGMTRALPDIGRQTLDAIGLRKITHGTIWQQIQLETFLRFGIKTDIDKRCKMFGSCQQALKIVPPQFATDIQVILRTRCNEDLESLVELLKQIPCYNFCNHYGFSYSYSRVRGYNHVFFSMEIGSELVEIRNRMEEYWQLVNGPWSGGQEQRKYINAWSSGVDFR